MLPLHQGGPIILTPDTQVIQVACSVCDCHPTAGISGMLVLMPATNLLPFIGLEYTRDLHSSTLERPSVQTSLRLIFRTLPEKVVGDEYLPSEATKEYRASSPKILEMCLN